MPFLIPDEPLISLDGVEQKYHALFVKSEDGKFAYSDPSKLANALRTTKETNQTITAELRDIKAQLESKKQIDPVKYQELLDRQEELEDVKRANNGELERIKHEIRSTADTQIAEARKGEETWKTRYALDRFEQQIEKVLVAKGASEAGVRLLKNEIIRQAKIEYEGDNPVYKFMDGSRIKLNAEADPWRIEDSVEQFKKDYEGLFNATGMGGSGATGGQQDLNDISDLAGILDWSPAKKIAYQTKFGDASYRQAVVKATQAKRDAINAESLKKLPSRRA